MKKKIYVILLILVLIMCSPISVFAEELHFKKLSFNMKEYWYYVTKDNIDGNSSISEFGVTEEYMKNLFETQSIYCEGVYKYTDNKEEWLEVYLQIFELDLDQKVNFNKVSDSEILKFGESMFESVNADYVKIETISDNKYVVAKYNDSVALNSGVVNANILQYYTIQDNVGYSFKFQKINDFSIGNERVMNELLSDVKFEQSSSSTNVLSKVLVAMVIGFIFSIGENIKASKNKNKQNDDNSQNAKNNLEEFKKCSKCGVVYSTTSNKECPHCSTITSEETHEKEKQQTTNLDKALTKKEKEKKPQVKKNKSNVDQKYSDLNKLKELLDNDVITKEEFDKEKKKILSDD